MPDTLVHAEDIIEEIIPAEEVNNLEQGRKQEIIQPLLDLGYITSDDNTALVNGIRLFRKEYLEQNLIPEFAPQFLMLPLEELEGEELNLLHMLTAVDGDFVLKSIPDFGHQNLSTRVVLYRLHLHGLYEGPTGAKLQENSFNNGLNQMRSWINNLPASQLDLINLLGDIPKLIRHLDKNSNGGLHKRVVVFKYQKAPISDRFFLSVQKTSIRQTDEDEQDKEVDNENKVIQDLKNAESSINELKQNETFNDVEQKSIQRILDKQEGKRSRLEALDEMFNITHLKLTTLNDDINRRGEIITEQLAPLLKIESDTSKRLLVLNGAISQKNGFIKELKDAQKQLKKKKRQLKRKIRKNKPQSEIDQLRAEIKQIENADKKIDQFSIEISKLHLEKIHLDETLRVARPKIKSFKKQEQDLIKERTTVFSEKQSKLSTLKDQIASLSAKVDKIRFSFRGRMKKVLDRDFYRQVVRKEIFQNRNRQLLQDFSEDHYNNYLIRLIQLFQWTNGYYYGKLDNEIGNRTYSALLDMEEYTRKLKMRFILTRLSENHSGSKGFWVLNIKYLIRCLTKILNDQDQNQTTKDLLEKYEKEFVNEDSNKRSVRNKVADKAYDEIVEENQQDIKNGGTIRRIYYGIKSIARTLIKAFDDLIQIIKRGIKELVYLVKNMIKIVYKEIREGVRKFRDGLKFLFGKRQFSTENGDGSAIMTKFDFDFDVVTYIPDHLSKPIVAQHAKTLYRFSNNLDFTMVLTGRVLKWVLNITSPLGWARLAIKIAIHFRKLILKWLVDLGKRITQHFIKVKYDIEAIEI